MCCMVTDMPFAILCPAKRWRGVSSVRPYSCIEGLNTLSCPVLPYTKPAALTESPGNTHTGHDILHMYITPANHTIITLTPVGLLWIIKFLILPDFSVLSYLKCLIGE